MAEALGADIIVDLRSDTVTKPTQEMRIAMMNAEVGDDVYGEDPTILKLQDMAAKYLGKESAIYVPTGTMGNLASIMAHCWERGKEILVGDESHIYHYEQGGAAQLAGVPFRTLRTNSDGTFDIKDIETKITEGRDCHLSRTGLICLENTHNRCGGSVLPMEYVKKVCELAKSRGIPVHMDGARIVNAAVHLGKPVASLVEECDSISMCLSKGLGAPAGTIVAGSSEFIKRVHRCRKALGGGMRQVGVLAATGILALTNAENKIQLDHIRAQRFATAIQDLDTLLLKVDPSEVQSNIVLLKCGSPSLTPEIFVSRMIEVTHHEAKTFGSRIIVKCCPWPAHSLHTTHVRCVFHCDISDSVLEAAIEKINYVINTCYR